jgi:hypothetical protein
MPTPIHPHQLVSQQQYCLDGKFTRAKVEQVLQAGAEQLHHHDVVVAFNAKPFDLRNTHCHNSQRSMDPRWSDTTARSRESWACTARTATLEVFVQLGLVLQLRVLAHNGLEFDGHLLAIRNVGACSPNQSSPGRQSTGQDHVDIWKRTDVNVAKRATANFPAEAVLATHAELHVTLLCSGRQAHQARGCLGKIGNRAPSPSHGAGTRGCGGQAGPSQQRRTVHTTTSTADTVCNQSGTAAPRVTAPAPSLPPAQRPPVPSVCVCVCVCVCVLRQLCVWEAGRWALRSGVSPCV